MTADRAVLAVLAPWERGAVRAPEVLESRARRDAVDPRLAAAAEPMEWLEPPGAPLEVEAPRARPGQAVRPEGVAGAGA